MVIVALLMAIACMLAIAFLFIKIDRLEKKVLGSKEIVQEPQNEEPEGEKEDFFSNDLQKIMTYSPSPKKRNELKRRGVD